MGQPNGGSVSVDVEPDTSGFERALQRALSRLGPVRVQVAPSDVPGFRRALQTALRRLPPVSVRVTPDTTRFQAALRAATRGMSVSVAVDIDTRAAAASLAAFRSTIGSIRSATIAVDLDTGAAAATLAALRAAVGTTTVSIHVRVTGDTAALAQIAAVTRAARTLARTSPTVRVGTSGGAGGRGGSGFADGGAYGRAFGAGMQSAARTIRPITIGANTSDVDRDIEFVRRAMARLSSQRIGIDITAEAARQDMDDLRRQLVRLTQQATTVDVQADTRAALLQLRNLQRQLDRIGRIDPKVNVGGLGLATSRIQTLISAGASIAPVIVPAAAAATAAIVALGAAAAVAGAAVGTALLGFSGIGGALSALRAPKTGGGGGGADQSAQLAQRRADALLAVQAAQRGLETAELDAAEAAIRSARRIEAADKAVATAQRDLTAARRDAIRTLEDLALANRRATIDSEEAQIALRRAEADLAAVNFDESKTDDQRRSAVLAVERAKLAIDEQAVANGRLKEETDAATAAGVDGATAVLEAQQALADAEIERADVAREVARQQRDTAISLLEANLALEKSQRDYIAALNDTGTSGAGGVDKVAEAMRKLSPAGREFVLFLNREVMPAIDRLKFTAQESMLPGVKGAIESLSPLFDRVKTLVGAMGAAVGASFQQVADALKSPTVVKFIDYLITEGPKLLGHLTKIGTGLLKIFATITTAFGPTTEQIFAGLADGLERFGIWLEKAVQSQDFKDFMAYIKENGPQVMKLIEKLVVVLVKVGIALAPLGELLLDGLVAVFDWLASLDPETILFIFGVIAFVIFALTGSVAALVIGIVALVALMVKAWPAIKEAIGKAWSWMKTNVFEPIGRFFTQTIPDWLSSLGDWFARTWKNISTWVSERWRWMVDNVFAPIGRFFTETIPGWLNSLGNWWNNFWFSISQTAGAWWNNIVNWIVDKWNSLVSWFSGLPGRIGNALSGMWDGIKNGFRNAINTVIRWWNSLDLTFDFGRFGKFTFGTPDFREFNEGGIVPGYTPGRDTGLVAVGGGEAIMRPEWTRAVGPSYVDAANAAARSGGTVGVEKFLKAFGAPRFATGVIVPSNLGIAAPMPRRDTMQQPVGQGQPLIGSVVLNQAQSSSRADLQRLQDGIGYVFRTGVVR